MSNNPNAKARSLSTVIQYYYGGGRKTTIEAISLVALLSASIIAVLTIVIDIVVFLHKKK